jgi:hypothetical protein
MHTSACTPRARTLHTRTPQDVNPAYNMLLRSELLGCECPPAISPDKATQLEQMRGGHSPAKKILRFRTGVCARGGGAWRCSVVRAQRVLLLLLRARMSAQPGVVAWAWLTPPSRVLTADA